MYITYDTCRWRVDDIGSGAVSGPYLQLPEHGSSILRSRFMPNFLVRVADMEVVPGHEANEGYYALSYAWSWCEVISDINGDELVNDDGLHKLISHENGEIIARSVKFDQIIRQFCQDLGIKYIWYDHMCIDQSGRPDEIRNIHRIYRHAYCTLILVPELEATLSDVKSGCKIKTANVDVILRSEWSKRMWTLQEVYTAKKLLFIGSNAYMWSEVATKSIYDLSGRTLYGICKRPLKWNASAALFHARNRKTRRLYDRTLAFANIFPEMMEDIEFRVDKDPLELLIQFYKVLAREDISVLCFGASFVESDDDRIQWPRKDQLPSWAGVTGVHIPHLPSTGYPPSTNFVGHKVDKEFLHVTSTCISIPVEKVPVCHENHVHSGWSQTWERSLEATLRGKSVKIVMSTGGYKSIGKHFGLRVSHRFPTNGGKLVWMDTSVSPDYTELFLSLTEEGSSECVILSGIAFEIGELYSGSRDFKAYPVVRKSDDLYKSIGLCFADDLEYISSDVEREHEFIIE